MTEYAYQLVDKFDGIYLSEDKTTVLFYCRESQYHRKLMDYFRYGWMFMQAIRPSQFFPTLRREKYIRACVRTMRMPISMYGSWNEN